MSRLFHKISTTACVILFALSAVMNYESQHYFLAGLFCFFVIYMPLEGRLDKWFQRKYGIDMNAAGASTGDGEPGSKAVKS